jgi:glycosyltransferase involved in cell wall biosynthesis
VKEHDLGQAVPPENPAALADALIAMRDDPARLAVQGKNARALGEREFDWKKLGEQFCDHLESIYAAKQR